MPRSVCFEDHRFWPGLEPQHPKIMETVSSYNKFFKTDPPSLSRTKLATGVHWTGLPDKNTDQNRKKRPKNVQTLASDNFWDIFGDIFANILSRFCFSGLSNDLPMSGAQGTNPLSMWTECAFIIFAIFVQTACFWKVQKPRFQKKAFVSSRIRPPICSAPTVYLGATRH